MNPLLLAAASYLGWGTGDVFGTITARKLGAYSTTLWITVFSLVIFSLFIPFQLAELQHLTGWLFVASLLLGIPFFIGELAFSAALHSSNASIAETIGASYTAITLIVSVWLYHEAISLRQIVPIVVIFLGAILCTLDFGELRRGRKLWNRGTLLAVVAMLTWGLYFALVKPIVREIGPFWPTYFVFLLLPLFFIFLRLRGTKVENPIQHQAIMPLVMSAFLLRGGDMIFNAALSHGQTAFVAPIAGAYPTLFVLLASFIFHDPITKQQKVGLALALLGVFVLSFAMN